MTNSALNLACFITTVSAYFWLWSVWDLVHNHKMAISLPKRFGILMLLCAPFNINGNVFTILGNSVSEKGNYSVCSIYQKAGRDAYTFISPVSIQIAKNDAIVLAGISGYQEAQKGAAGILAGVSFYQSAGEDAYTIIGASGYQSAKYDAVVPLGLSGYQSAEYGDAVTFLGISGYQSSGKDAGVLFGLSFAQLAKRDAVNLIGLSAYQSAGNDAFVGLGVAGYQSSAHIARTPIGIAGYQSVGDKSRFLGVFSALSADKN